MSRPGCPKCFSTHVTLQGLNHFCCKECGRRFSASTAAGAPLRSYPTKQCPRCGTTPHIKAGKPNGKPRWQCKSCGLKHTPDQRERSRAVENHQTPPCPRCQNPTPDRNGIDYRYEKQAYLCRACGKTFRVQLTRFAPVHLMDEIADEAVKAAHDIAQLLMSAGAFAARNTLAEQGEIARSFAGALAGELYLTRIGERFHETLEDAITRAVSLINEQERGRPRNRRREAIATISLAEVLARLPLQFIAGVPLTPLVLLDRVAAQRDI